MPVTTRGTNGGQGNQTMPALSSTVEGSVSSRGSSDLITFRPRSRQSAVPSTSSRLGESAISTEDGTTTFHTLDRTGTGQTPSGHDTPSRHSMSASLTSFRLDKVETDIKVVRNDIGGMRGQMNEVNLKLGQLLSNMETGPPPQRSSTPASKRPSRTMLHPVEGDATQASAPDAGAQEGLNLPTPSVIKRLPQHQHFIAHHLKQEELQHRPTDGKLHFVGNILAPHPIAKPYMFLEKEGMSTLKQKLEYRHLMLREEYMSAFLALLNKKDAYDPEFYPDMFRHLHHVSVDSMVRPWAHVRKWSQLLFDRIESGGLYWSDRVEIQDERVRLSMTGGVDRAPAAPAGQSHSQGSQRVASPCSDYNADKCRHKHDHDEGAIKLLHVCSYCHGKGKRLHHSIAACQNKYRDAPPPAWPAQQQQPRGAVNANVYQQQQTPKN